MIAITDIETRIRERGYQSPGRARAAVTRLGCTRKEKARLVALVDAWESEGVPEIVVGGVPVIDSVEGATIAPVRLLPAAKPRSILTISLDAAIRARLTPFGVSVLFAARDKVNLPPDLLENQGVWETTLGQLMLVMGEHMVGDEPVTLRGEIELVEVGG